MKTKKTVLSMLCAMVIVLILALAACENPTDRTKQSSVAANTVSDAGDSANTFYEETQQPDGEGAEQKPESEPLQEQEPTYYHAAICGAVVTEQDGSARFTYVKKCENCGNIQGGNNIANATGGVLRSSFLCSECGETQQFEIETTKN